MKRLLTGFHSFAGVRLAAVRRIVGTAALFGLCLAHAPAQAQTALADQPLFTYSSVPGNLLLSLSVEFPTAISVANNSAYVAATQYYGYFDSSKCYLYRVDPITYSNSYFYPSGTYADSNHYCSNSGTSTFWSGNWLNWASMQTVDPFRAALTGGYRAVDTPAITILEKAYGATQGSAASNFPDRTTTSVTVSNVMPVTGWGSSIRTRIWGLGNLMYFTYGGTGGGNVDAPVAVGTVAPLNVAVVNYDPSTVPLATMNLAANVGVVYAIAIRVQVCTPTSVGPPATGLEANCTQYGSNWKPEGLMQQYNQKIRYGAFGYLNDGNIKRDGGVLRARMAFVGPMQPNPGLPATANPNAEWSSVDGTYFTNPDSNDAALTNASAVCANALGVTIPCASNSGVLNYLNKFGEASHSYKTYDPVSELYYAGIRYYKNIGNVPEYTTLATTTNNGTRATWVDGFPVITNWEDPILYGCQKNFILGIGDIHTHDDGNLYGGSPYASNEPALPTTVAADTSVNVQTATNLIAAMETAQHTAALAGNTTAVPTAVLNQPLKYAGGDQNTYFMAGLAFDSHVNDMRPVATSCCAVTPKGTTIQTVSTYWLDVVESGDYQYRNAFWLAAKYGGFTYTPGQTVPTFLPLSTWTGAFVGTVPSVSDLGFGSVTTSNQQAAPNNYYNASQAVKMVAGLNQAFSSISNALTQTTTAIALSSPVLSASGNVTYSTSYNATNWQSVLIQSQLLFAADGTPYVGAQNWSADQVLTTRLNPTTGAGYPTRFIATCCTAAGKGTNFEASTLPTTAAADWTLLGADTASRTAALNYLRGDKSNETPLGYAFRARPWTTLTGALGDIVDSKIVVVGPPAANLSESLNTGYTAFKTSHATRSPMVYVGANDGMFHAFNAANGSELFAYVPSPLYQGPTAPTTDGLLSLLNVTFTHHYFVDAPPVTGDVNVAGVWSTLLVSGLGKGGKSYFAIDVTDPLTAVTSETAASNLVKWEFTDPTMGFSYGRANIIKTKKYGWVVVLTSGYNNADGVGYFYFVNPSTGALLEKVSTGVGSLATPSGLMPATAFIPDYSDGTADSIYAGDLLGNLWRLDLTGTSGLYPTPAKLAFLADSTGVGQPITTRPLPEITPTTNARRVLVGTGKLLDPSDIGTTQIQTFYDIIDGTAGSGAFSPATSPITRSALSPLTFTGSQSLQVPLPASTTTSGFYVDLGAGPNNVSYRVNVELAENFGDVIFAANLPNGDACNPQGTGRVFALNIANGASVLAPNSGSTLAAPYNNIANGTATDIVVISIPPGTVTSTGATLSGGTEAIVGGSGAFGSGSGSGGGSGLQGIQLTNSPTGTLKHLNWRELPTPD